MKPKQYKDEDLITMILQSNSVRKEALRFIYLQWRNNATAILMKSGASLTDAQDAIQESIIVLDNSIRCGKYKKTASLKNYFIGICKGRLYSNKRSNRRMDLVDPTDRIDGIDQQNPETLMLEQEEKAVINQMLDVLDSRCKQLLTLYRLSFSMKEIAQELDISNAANVRQRVFQCRKKMMQLVAKNPLFSNYFNTLS